MLDLAFWVSRGFPPEMSREYSHIYNLKNLDRMQIIKEDNRVVSHIILWPVTLTIEGIPFKVGALGGAATHPEYRGRGYSTILLKHCLRLMQAQGYDFSVLWTGGAKAPGWELGGRALNYVILRERANALPELRDSALEWQLSDADWEGLDLIRQRLPVSTVRLPGWTRTVAEAGRCLVLVAKRTGRLVAYTINRGHEIKEFGGEPECVAGLIRLRFEEYAGQTQISLPCVPPGEFADLLDRLGFECRVVPVGMLRLIKPASVLEKLGIAGITIQPVGENLLLRWSGRQVQLDQRQLVKFFFTAAPEFSSRPEGLPVFPFCWLLDHV
jgi:GNAT superfamily N-acetyltransferase